MKMASARSETTPAPMALLGRTPPSMATVISTPPRCPEPYHKVRARVGIIRYRLLAPPRAIRFLCRRINGRLSMNTNATDVLIIGAGHNGLVCAYYLAAAGLKVRVVERRDVVGGAAVTEEFHPGFRNSVASYTVSLLNPKIIADLELARHGLRIVDRKLQNFLPLNDREYLAVGAGRTKAEVAKFSNRDAERLDAYGG